MRIKVIGVEFPEENFNRQLLFRPFSSKAFLLGRLILSSGESGCIEGKSLFLLVANPPDKQAFEAFYK
jgi:hypothetical protein